MVASLKKDDFRKGDRAQLASFRLVGLDGNEVQIPTGRIGTILEEIPDELRDIARIVLDGFSYGGLDFDGIQMPMRLNQLERIGEAGV